MMISVLKVALVLPHADLVVCLDGHGGIAAVCPPSELSATLKQSMHDAARKNNANNSSESTRSISSSSGTDSEITSSTATVVADNGVKCGPSLGKSSSKSNKDMAEDTKTKLTRSESNGFFDLLSALPGMAGIGVEVEAAPSLSSSPSSSLSSSGQADDASSPSFFDTDITGNLDIFSHNDGYKNKNGNAVIKNEKEKGKEGVEKHKNPDKIEDRHTKETNNLMILKSENKLIAIKNIDSFDGGGDDANLPLPHQSAALLVEKETKSAGTIGIDVYWFYIKSGGGVAAVLLVAISNIFLPSAW